MLSFSKNFLSILQMSPGLLECYVFVLVFHILVILQKVLERFLHSSSHLIMTQIFILFDCLRPLGVSSIVNFQLLVQILL